MTAQPLGRQGHPRRANPEQPFLGDLSLALSRVHEFCGNARRTLAMVVAGATVGPVFWIAPGRARGRLNPDGMAAFAEPGRFTFLQAPRPADLLWSMEEVLRSGAVGLVVADIPAPPALTPVRRLQLAAEAGATNGGLRPLGLILTPGDGGAQGVESRWHMAGDHGHDAGGWVLSRTRARAAPVASWRVVGGDQLRLCPGPDQKSA